MRRTLILTVVATLCHPSVWAAESAADSISHRIVSHASPLPRLTSMSWENPALRQWQWDTSLSSVGATYTQSHQAHAVNPQTGTGGHQWRFDAESYMKHKSSTLWGEAAYANGRIRNKQWCEAVDIDIIYPYYPADERGGSLNMELYSFSGGYADHAGRWGWGASAGYTAGLYYRPVDPRPKDVTGKLQLNAGGSMEIGRYRLAAGAEFIKYKQSVSITFISEMGEDKIYHTTGMGTHYVRFAGNGSTTYYNGIRYGLSINLLPKHSRGFYASAAINRLSFNTILADLNRLPLCGAWHNELRAQGGYMHRADAQSWGIGTDLRIYKRRGHENIFGDASGGIYPQIGEVDTYADNGYKISVQGCWQRAISHTVNLWATAKGSYMHRCEAYFTPGRQSLWNRAGMNLSASASAILPHGWSGIFTASWSGEMPMSDYLTMRETDSPTSVPQLIEIERTRHRYNTLRSHTLCARIAISRAIAGKYAVQIAGETALTDYRDAAQQRQNQATISFIF